ncbi:MAG: hypothetical protein Q9157_003596 [Trypethelium eluteriae]
MLKSFGTDDILMIVTLVLFTAYLVCQLGGLANGTGHHMVDLEPHKAMIALKFWWFCELFYISCSCFLKIAIGQFLLRIAVVKVHIWIIRLVMVSTAIFGTFYIFLAIFQCRPPSEWWANLRPNTGPHCFSADAMVKATYTAGALNTIADWTLGILPIFIVRNLSMNRKIKAIVAGILSFAAIGSTATIVRIPFTEGLRQSDDFLWSTAGIALWSTVEPGIGITAGCLATLRPLFNRIMIRAGLTSNSRDSSMMLGGRGSAPRMQGYIRRRSGDLGQLRPDLEIRPQGTVTTITGQPREPPKRSGLGKSWRDRSESSDDSPVEGQQNIISKSVEVTYEEMELMENGGLCAVKKV